MVSPCGLIGIKIHLDVKYAKKRFYIIHAVNVVIMNKEKFVDGMFDQMLDQNLLENPAKNTIKITKKGIFYWNILNEIIKRDKVDTSI